MKDETARTYHQAFPPQGGLSARLRAAAKRAALATLGRVARTSPEPRLRLLYCHHVFDDEVTSFAARLRQLLEMGRFVDTATAVSIVCGEAQVTQSLFHLSFDDGYRNIVTNALPVLRDLGIPSILFVPTRQLGVEHWTYAARIEMATWDDLEAARNAGMEIGSHTRDHLSFSEISSSPATLEAQIAGSKADIEQHLGECRYISWPFGRRSDADAVSLAAVKQAGYAACFGAFRGTVEPGKTDRFRIPRHHFEPHWPASHLRYFALGGGEGRAA